MLNGIINVYKEKGFTSHDVVAKLRGILHQKKIGHTGTLDPDAEGVLPVCLGKATKLCDMLTDKDKTYEAVLLLGTETDTQDVTGKTLSQYQGDFTAFSREHIIETIESFIGAYHQIPPMYSALKVNGKKLYELAREGKEIERQPRLVYIHNIVINKIDLPKVSITVECSKGTYIRTLCHDIGKVLGCGGCMDSLIRTKAGRFSIKESLTLDQIAEAKESLRDYIFPIDAMFEIYPDFIVAEEFNKLLYNGNKIPLKDMDASDITNGCVRVYDSSRHFVGIYECSTDEQILTPKKMFLDN